MVEKNQKKKGRCGLATPFEFNALGERWGLNPRPAEPQTAALPAELRSPSTNAKISFYSFLHNRNFKNIDFIIDDINLFLHKKEVPNYHLHKEYTLYLHVHQRLCIIDLWDRNVCMSHIKFLLASLQFVL